jgi:hypothetical protein
MNEREKITPAHPTAAQRHFHFYDANHLYLMTIALTRKNKNNKQLQNTNHP